MTKSEIRTLFQEKRANLSADDREELSTKISERLHDFLKDHPFKTFHIFLPSVRHMEVNTLLIVRLLQDWDGVRFVVPVSDYENHTMKHVLYKSGDDLQIDRVGIPEPVEHKEINISELEAVITPLLAFDEAGHRLGYGKGFYDRFFASIEHKVAKIGVSFFEVLNEKLPSDVNDQPLDYCVTPDKIYKF